MRLGTLFRCYGEEAGRWWRFAQQLIPGEIGCWVRRNCYGFVAGTGTRVLENVTIYHPQNLQLGNGVGISSSCQLNAAGGIVIEDDVLVGPGCMIWSQNHNFSSQTDRIRSQGYTLRLTVIETDSWIGAGATILPGVRIGRGTIVAAGAVVTRNTAPFSIVAGVPAALIGVRGVGSDVSTKDRQESRSASRTAEVSDRSVLNTNYCCRKSESE